MEYFKAFLLFIGGLGVVLLVPPLIGAAGLPNPGWGAGTLTGVLAVGSLSLAGQEPFRSKKVWGFALGLLLGAIIQAPAEAALCTAGLSLWCR